MVISFVHPPDYHVYSGLITFEGKGKTEGVYCIVFKRSGNGWNFTFFRIYFEQGGSPRL